MDNLGNNGTVKWDWSKWHTWKNSKNDTSVKVGNNKFIEI